MCVCVYVYVHREKDIDIDIDIDRYTTYLIFNATHLLFHLMWRVDVDRELLRVVNHDHAPVRRVPHDTQRAEKRIFFKYIGVKL